MINFRKLRTRYEVADVTLDIQGKEGWVFFGLLPHYLKNQTFQQYIYSPLS